MIGLARLADKLLTGLQAILPQHALSTCLHWLTRRRFAPLVQTLLRVFVAAFRVDLSWAAQPDLSAYADVNAFFTRGLRPGARPIASRPQDIASPVDATVSEFGAIDGLDMIQAKGRRYTLPALLADRADLAAQFRGGEFITLYLSPRDYHRVHCPVTATLRGMTYVPGRLFAVNPRTARTRDRLYARNERAICEFTADRGPFALLLVGAIGVGSIETVWSGPIPRRGSRQPAYTNAAEFGRPAFTRGDEIGRFNLGSTVILLFPPATLIWRADLRPGIAVKMGESIASYRA